MNTDLPLVSVIIPCYNAELFVKEALDSILNQSYRHLEVLCIDDCSKDKTLSILYEYAQNDSRVKVFTNPVNMKLAAALNIGLEHAHGKYIARMDADDISVFNRIELQVEFLERNPQIDICGGQCIIIDKYGYRLGKMEYLLSNDELKPVLLFDSCFAHPSVLFRKSIYESIGGYEELMPIEDLEYWIRMSMNGFKMANLSCVLLYYRVHGNNVTTLNNDERKIAKIHKLYDMYPAYFGDIANCCKYNMRFLLGNWNLKTTYTEWNSISQISTELYERNKQIKLFDDRCLKKTISYYKCRAYISCAKSTDNSFKVRLYSLMKLLTSIGLTMKTVFN